MLAMKSILKSLQAMVNNIKFNKTTIIGLLIICAIFISCILSSVITSKDPNTHGDLVQERYLPPSSEHPFGTDKFGRDLFARVLYGGRISIVIAFTVVLLSITIGVFYGSISGYFGGRIDGFLMRILDFLYAFPLIFLIITVIAIFKTFNWYLIPLLALTGWMETARLLRAEVLSLREREFVLAAKGLGLSHFRVILNHIIPNCLHVLFAIIPLKVAEIILLESALSFLGIGVQQPLASWGNIINDGREVLLSAWWISTLPGIMITLTVLGLHLLGDGIRESVDKRLN